MANNKNIIINNKKKDEVLDFDFDFDKFEKDYDVDEKFKNRSTYTSYDKISELNTEYIKDCNNKINKISINEIENVTNKFNTLLYEVNDKISKLNSIKFYYNIVIKSLVNHELNLKSANKNYQYKDVKELYTKLENYDQKLILSRIMSDNDDYAKIYLQGYVVNIDPKKKTLLGTINILGQYNDTKKKRESYDVKVLKNEPKGTFWCSCADHKFNSTKKGIVCKHISFIVCKVMKILQLYYWDTKILSDEHLQLLLDKFNKNSDFWNNKDLVRDLKELSLNTFKTFLKPIEDTCTFCYDDMTDADKNIALCCPNCKHCFHEECMNIWLENYQKCSYCSSNIWKHYNDVKNNKIINIGSGL